jgi:6-phosphofructokinase 1
MRIALTTTGGDAPGLNAVICSATRTALSLDHEIFGIRNGFAGLLENNELIPLDERAVEGIDRTGGTILGAASSGVPFGAEGRGVSHLVQALKRFEIDALIMVGGDGTMRIAHEVATAGIRVVAVPKTIDRDVVGTYSTFGFDTAVSTATEAIDRLHTTAASHNRLMVVEVMGRDTGWIALYAGIGGGAAAIALPEFPYNIEIFASHIRRREAARKHYHILVCAEGARPAGGDVTMHGRTGRLGGVAEYLAAKLQEVTGKESRALSLGHLLRGGPPVTSDRLLGLRFGAAAVGTLERGFTDCMVAYQPPGFTELPLADVAGRINCLTAETPELRTASGLGISLGM